MITVPQASPDFNPATKSIPQTYTEVAKTAERLGFTLGRARRSGVYPLLWTTPAGNQHVFIKSLDRVLPFISFLAGQAEAQEGGPL